MQFPRLMYNKVSTAGVALAVITGLTMIFLLAIRGPNPYVGVFVYMVLPPFVFVGLLLIPIGMIRQWRRVRKYGRAVLPRWPLVDFNNQRHRNAFIFFLAATFIYAIASAIGGYQAYHHSESVEFCGTTCHTVMKPEYVAYQNSSHARVPCTACHVGAGAGWYARSKLSGAYQVYATALNKYPRPIPTPVKNLRPAQETCERCHWPAKFFGAQQRVFNHYMYDEKNSFWPINMLIKTGGGDSKSSQRSGIHWHMNIANKLEYIARDERRQDIPWIRITNGTTGEVTVYQDEDDPLSEEEIAATTPRRMDCMDCHNRPSHKYLPPDNSVDHAIAAGKIDQSLPEIKLAAVEAMTGDFDTEADAMEAIRKSILKFYEDGYPEVLKDNRKAVNDAIEAVQYQFTQTMFPEMKVRWDRYPDNIGHFINPGCMRCHLGNKVSEDGKKITHDCYACHIILSQGSGDRAQMATEARGLEFVHPDPDDEGDWRDTGCFECHSGTQP